MTAGGLDSITVRDSIEPGSFRDWTARVFYFEGQVYRGLTATAWEEWQPVARSHFFEAAVGAQQIVATDVVDRQSLRGLALDPSWVAILHHQTIPFITYPYEWCFGMLKDAALLQLELVASALSAGVALKDATPFNIQWLGVRPIFIDVASFVRWQPGQPWTGYRQFCRMFLYPLFLQAYKGVAFHPWLRGRLDGIAADECRRLLSWRDVFRPGVLAHVVANSQLEQRLANTPRDIRQELHDARFDPKIVANTVAGLTGLVSRLQWGRRSSAWTEYVSQNSYGQDAALAKERFVETILNTPRRRLVWDLGCNTGHFARIASRTADCVVAMDSDHESIEHLYRELRKAGTRNVVPLVMDLADPSPALGWRGRERRPLPDRGRPDLVLCLALVHHLALTANLPLADLVSWFAELGAELVVELPTPEDPMSRRLLRNRGTDWGEYSVESFERCLAAQFDVRERLTLPGGTRILYHATPKHRGADPQAGRPAWS